MYVAGFLLLIFLKSLLSQWECFAMGNSGCFPQGKPATTESRCPTLIDYKVHAGSFRVSVLWRGLHDLYRAHVIIVMRAYNYSLHGGWAHRQRVSKTFGLKQTFTFSCSPNGVRTSGSLDLWSDTLPLEPPPVDPVECLYNFLFHWWWDFAHQSRPVLMRYVT